MNKRLKDSTHVYSELVLCLDLLALASAAATILVLVVVQYTWYSLATSLFVLVPLTFFLALALTTCVLCNLRRDLWSARDRFVALTAMLLFFLFVCFPVLFLLWAMGGGAFANGVSIG